MRITATDVERLTPVLEVQGFEIIASSPEHQAIEGWVYTASVANVGEGTSQADGIHQTDRVQLGFDSTGVTVGIMSDSFNNLRSAAAGDLLERVQVLQEFTGVALMKVGLWLEC